MASAKLQKLIAAGYEFSGIHVKDKTEAKDKAANLRNLGKLAQVVQVISQRKAGASSTRYSVYTKYRPLNTANITKLPFIWIKDEINAGYQGVFISWGVDGKKKIKRFLSGDICLDYKRCLIFSRSFTENCIDCPVMLSSSVDHWCFDNKGYFWKTETIDREDFEVIARRK